MGRLPKQPPHRRPAPPGGAAVSVKLPKKVRKPRQTPRNRTVWPWRKTQSPMLNRSLWRLSRQTDRVNGKNLREQIQYLLLQHLRGIFRLS